MASGNRSFMFLRFLNDLSDQGNNARPALVMRSAATWLLLKIVSCDSVYIPSFMRMKELPQIAESPISIIQFNQLICMPQNYAKIHCE